MGNIFCIVIGKAGKKFVKLILIFKIKNNSNYRVSYYNWDNSDIMEKQATNNIKKIVQFE